MTEQVSSNSPRTVQHYRGLDGLRGFAALLVFLSHASLDHMHLLGLDFGGIGKCGVALFFILSAHLLTLQFMHKGEQACLRPSSLGIYFIRRFMRIYPLYFVYLGTALATTWASAEIFLMKPPDGVPLTLDWSGWIRQLLLMQGDGVTWSIAVEFKYYFLLPLVALILHFLGRKGRLPQLLLMITAIFTAELLSPRNGLFENDPRLSAYLGVFLTGSLSGLIGSYWESLPTCRNRILFGFLIVAIVFIALTTPPLIRLLGIASEDNYHPDRWMFLHGVAFVPLILAASYSGGITGRIFSGKFLRFVGMISFSLYLWHPVFIKGGARLIKGIDPTLVAWIALAATLAASYISYRLIEKPFLKLGTAPRAANTSPEPERQKA